MLRGYQNIVTQMWGGRRSCLAHKLSIRSPNREAERAKQFTKQQHPTGAQLHQIDGATRKTVKFRRLADTKMIATRRLPRPADFRHGDTTDISTGRY